MLSEVVVAPVMDAFELLESEREFVLDIPRRLGIENEVLMLVPAEMFLFDSEIEIVLPSLLAPFLIGRGGLVRPDEVLHLHLFEFALAEDELSCGDLVAERLADLRDAERNLHARRIEHVLEIDVDALTRLAAEIRRFLRPVPGEVAEIGLHEEIEALRLGEALLPAFRADDRVAVLVEKSVDLLFRHFFIRLHARLLEEMINAYA